MAFAYQFISFTFMFCQLGFLLYGSEANDSGGLSIDLPEFLALLPTSYAEITPGHEFADPGILPVPANKQIDIRVLGSGLADGIYVKFTPQPGNLSERCDGYESTKAFPLEKVTGEVYGVLSVNLEVSEVLYVCFTAPNGIDYYHSGLSTNVKLRVYEEDSKFLPLWLQIIFIFSLLCLSGLFSGLNLGLMALDLTELKIIQRCGTASEKNYANRILPVRAHGNYLLCSLLLGNVLVNNGLTILIDDLSNGIIAVVCSTIAIVIFGEIVPQSICSRHGLSVGANTIIVTKFFMLLTFIVSFPISKILDRILGEELGHVYSKERLIELLKLAGTIETEEIEMVSGALALKNKTVLDVMTPLDDCYMLDYSITLSFDTMSDIMKRGFTRIPVYDVHRTNVVALLWVKDLAFVDPDDNIPLKTLCRYYQHPVKVVYDDTRLDVMLDEFKQGHSHLVFVHKVLDDGISDPVTKIIGVCTLEDVIEEIIQSEIVDETDCITDNRTKRAIPERIFNQDLSVFKGSDHRAHMSPQLRLASFQFLSSEVEPFTSDHISDAVLHRLLDQDIVINHALKADDKLGNTIVSRGRVTDAFIMVLQGRVTVFVGKEDLKFETGPFSFFGVSALTAPHTGSLSGPQHRLSTGSLSGSLAGHHHAHLIPDFTVLAATDLQYIKIRRSQYLAAKQATAMALGVPHQHAPEDIFGAECDSLVSPQRSGAEPALSPPRGPQSGESSLGTSDGFTNPLGTPDGFTSPPGTQGGFNNPLITADSAGEPSSSEVSESANLLASNRSGTDNPTGPGKERKLPSNAVTVFPPRPSLLDPSDSD